MSTLSDLIYEKSKDLIDEAYDKGRNAGGYGEGFEAGQDALWDAVQNNGTRTDYSYAFANWRVEYLRPKHKVIPTVVTGVANAFLYCKGLKKIESQYFDFSQKPYATGYNRGYDYLCAVASDLEEIEDIGLVPQCTYQYAFSSCSKLHTIAKLGSDETTTFTDTFAWCSALKNITIDGVIGQNISFANSSLLSVASMDSIYAALKTYTSGTHTLTLHASAWARWDAAYPSLVAQYGSMKNYVTSTKGWATS